MNTPCTRQEALDHLKEHVHTDSLMKHSLAVEASMRHFARYYGEDEEYWGMVGLLHDIDYGEFPEEHLDHAPEMLRGYGFDEDFIRHVLSHGYNLRNQVEPIHPMEKVLYTVDELSGFITACALVRPSKSVLDLEVKSVKKKFKQDSFAAAVNRAVIQDGADRMGMPLEEVMAETILGLREAADTLDLGIHTAQ